MDPINPVEVGFLEIPTLTSDIEIEGTIVYLTLDDNAPSVDPGRLQLVDVSDPTSPRFMGAMHLSEAQDVAVDDGLV